MTKKNKNIYSSILLYSIHVSNIFGHGSGKFELNDKSSHTQKRFCRLTKETKDLLIYRSRYFLNSTSWNNGQTYTLCLY